MANTVTVEGSGHECDVKLQIWLKDLLPRTPGAVRRVVTRELILASREFFERSAAWRTTLGPKDMIANKKRYSLSPYDAYSDIIHVLGVEMDGMPLRPLTRRPADINRTMDRPTSFWLEEPDTVRLYPTPTTTVEDTLTFYVALIPKESVTKLPRIARTHFYEALLDGALGRLYAHPAKPYSDTQKATYHLNRFRGAIGSYAGAAKNGFTGGQSWNFPSFGK